MSNPTPPSTSATPRPIGVAHLVFGLVFTGIAAIWLIGEANDTDVPDLAIAFPAVLIGAGLIGLVATLVSHGRARTRLAANAATYDEAPVEESPAEETPLETTTTDDTTTIEENDR